MPWEPAPGALLGGKYRLERALAAGGMGSVWVARHERLDALVAVKVLSGAIGLEPSSIARFEREAKACAQLQSPHVVTVHDFGLEDATPYMVMELLRGEDLGDRIDRVGHLSLAEAVAIAVPIGKALRVAHEAGIIHRDLKPRNIFLARQGDDEVVKLVDFGIARETKTKLVDERTASGIVMGSPYHMSPEQAQALPVDHRTDLWGLAIVLYRLVTGFRPFDGDNVTSVLMTICMSPHPLPSQIATGLSPETDAFFAKALAKDPARRFQSAKEMVDAFVAVAEGRSTSAEEALPGSTATPHPWSSSPARELPDPGARGSSGSQAAAALAQTPASAPQAVLGAQTPSSSQAVSVAERASQDPSASLALRAVSTGAQAPAQLPATRFGLVIGVIGALAAAAAVGFFLFEATRGAPPASPALGAASLATSAAPSAAPSIAPPTGASETSSQRPSEVVVAPIPSASASAAPSASASAVPSPAPSPPRSYPRPPPPPRPTGGGSGIDPFTGLPVAR
jgi:serine/threonine protein kinase